MMLAVASALFGLMLGSREPILSRLALDSGTTAGRAVARAPCPPRALGRIQSHPGAERCWYGFPGTRAETSDAVLFRRGGYPVDATVYGPTRVHVTRASGPEAQSLAVVDRTVRVALASVAVPFASAEDRVTRKLFAGPAVDREDAIPRRKGRQLDGGSIERWARALRSAARPRISQSLRLTVTYRRPIGARLGIVVAF